MTNILQLCCSQASRIVLNSLFCFLFGFGEVKDLMFGCFGFLSNLPAFATWSGFLGRQAMLLTLNITELIDGP